MIFRLKGLIPIHYEPKNITSFDSKKYEFFIDITNNTINF